MLKNVIKKLPRIFLLFLILLAIASYKKKIFNYKFFAKKGKEQQVATFTVKDIRTLFPRAKQWDQQKGLGSVYDDKKNIIGYILNTSPYADDIIGYASNVPLLIGLTPEKKVVGMVLLENAESEDFVANIKKEKFFTRWNGLSIDGALAKQVDTITGATMTTKAIIQTVQKRLSLLGNYKVKERVDYYSWIKKAGGGLLLCLAILSFYFKKIRSYRLYLLLATIIVFGIWQGKFISSVLLYGWLINGFPIYGQFVLVCMVLVSLLIPLFTNKSFYCVYVCPYGAAQELVGKCRKKKVPLSSDLKTFLRTLRLRLFIIIVFLLVIGFQFDLTNVEPFSAFIFQSASLFVIIIATIFLVLSIFLRNHGVIIFAQVVNFLLFYVSHIILSLKRRVKK